MAREVRDAAVAEADDRPMYHAMSEEELALKLKGSLLILSTTSADKRDAFRKLFTSLGIDAESDVLGVKSSGVDLSFTHSGLVNVVPSKTPEVTGSYDGNLDEKARQQIDILGQPDMMASIRAQLGRGNRFDPATVRIMGMTEDAGFSLLFEDPAKRQAFIDNVKKIILPDDRSKAVIRDEDRWLVDQLESDSGKTDPHDSGFPGANLHPLLERLGGFNKLMEVVYEAAEQADIQQDLRFRYTTHVSFTDPQERKICSKQYSGEGKLLNRREYEERLLSTKDLGAINPDFVQVFDRQGPGNAQPLDRLKEQGIMVRSSEDLPADFPRRKMVEDLQQLVGKREVDGAKKGFNVAFDMPGARETGEEIDAKVPVIPGMRFRELPSREELLRNPSAKYFDDADVVVLVPKRIRHNDQELYNDPNLGLVLDAIVMAEIDPQSMSKPIILDNRSGRFDAVLSIIKDEFIHGRLIGEMPFYIADSDDKMRTYLKEVQTITGQSPKIKKLEASDAPAQEMPEPANIPDDGVFSVFIGGGHNNNNKRDLEEANKLGYLCAEKGYRIVTGAGSIEGSMGAVHTGFIQYHLEQIKDSNVSAALDGLIAEMREKSTATVQGVLERYPQIAERLQKAGLGEFLQELSEITDRAQVMDALDKRAFALGSFGRELRSIAIRREDQQLNAEDIVLNHATLVDSIADAGFIPRNMFYGYSMQNLLKLENPSGNAPPGITYSDVGNLSRRLTYLLSPGNKVFMPGGIGTDQEFEETVKQHLDARARGNGAANDSVFRDGTRDDEGAMIIYNREGNLDKLLDHYRVLGGGAVGDIMRKRYNIKIVTSEKELQEALVGRAGQWLQQKAEPAAAR